MQQQKPAPNSNQKAQPSSRDEAAGNPRAQDQARPNPQPRYPEQQNTQDARRDGGQRNEGEGNRTAAREYNNATERFAQSGKVAESGARAREAVEDRDQKAELERAERIGKSKLREEDPAVAREPRR